MNSDPTIQTNEEILAAISKNALEIKRLELRIEMLENALEEVRNITRGWPRYAAAYIDSIIQQTKEWKSPL